MNRWNNLVWSLPLLVAACGADDSGDCVELAKKCPYCTLPYLRSTCEAAVASKDQKSCRDGLNDNDIQTNCVSSAPTRQDGGGGAKDTAGGAGSACAELATKCPLCSLPHLKATCEAAVASGDTQSCVDGLEDHDVQTNCR